MKYVDDKDLQKEFMDVKMERKKILAAYIKDTLHIDIDVNSNFSMYRQSVCMPISVSC